MIPSLLRHQNLANFEKFIKGLIVSDIDIIRNRVGIWEKPEAVTSVISASIVVAHPQADKSELSSISGSNVIDYDDFPDDASDLVATDSLESLNDGSSNDLFEAVPLEDSHEFSNAPLLDDSNTYVATESDPACAMKPSKRDSSGDLSLGDCSIYIKTTRIKNIKRF